MTKLSRKMRFHVALALALAFSAYLFFSGITWGLPSHAADVSLFGQHHIWSGGEISSLAPRRAADQAADVDLSPASRGAFLNEADGQRAEIVRRYRLFSRQPDEMITFMALAAMHPAHLDFDPRLYQYGGLWIYPVGVLIKLFKPVSDQAFYLDHPERFARFYVAARAYSACWGLIGVATVFQLVRRYGGSAALCLLSAILFASMPVVVNAAHEAKPHLAGTSLLLLAVLETDAFLRNPMRMTMRRAGLFCGAASGMVLSGFIAWLLIPLALLSARLRGREKVKLLIGATLSAAAVYAVANPYVLIHLIHGRTVLSQNLLNSAAMYASRGPDVLNAIKLMINGVSLPLACAALAATGLLALNWRRREFLSLWLLTIIGAAAFIGFAAHAAGKPAEYSRFALPIDATLVLLIGGGAVVFAQRSTAGGARLALTLVVLCVACRGLAYTHGFARDADSARRSPEQFLEEKMPAGMYQGAQTIGVWAEPAPYCLPPVNLFRWRIKLLDSDFTMQEGAIPADVLIRPADHPAPQGTDVGAYRQIFPIKQNPLLATPISWADKAFEIWVRRALLQ